MPKGILKRYYGYYHIYKNDPRCKAEIERMRENGFPDFAHCGKGKTGYVILICNNCPHLEQEK